MARTRTEPAPLATVGWREWVTLPDLAPGAVIKAKIDTGAATSSLHAYKLRMFERDGQPWCRFEIHPRQRSTKGTVEVEVPVATMRKVRSSSGHAEERPVIRTVARIGDHVWPVEVTLTSRDAMGFRMLIGRKALRRRAVVDVSRSYVAGRPANGEAADPVPSGVVGVDRLDEAIEDVGHGVEHQTP